MATLFAKTRCCAIVHRRGPSEVVAGIAAEAHWSAFTVTNFVPGAFGPVVAAANAISDLPGGQISAGYRRSDSAHGHRGW